jgi:pimeloyl-ACP methyl ester carboxylesterase
MTSHTETPGELLWFEAVGEGEPFVLLHPGGVDSRAFGPLVEQLAGRYRLITPDQRGHGRSPDRAGPLSYDGMADDTIALIEQQVGGPVHLLGYSDGAVVALQLTLRRPDLVRDLVFAAGVFHRDGWAPGVLDVEPEGTLGEKLAAMHATEPTFTEAELAGIRCPVLVLLGDDDEVLFEHAIAFYEAVPRGELAVVPHASHGVLVEKPELSAMLVSDFHRADKPATFAPRRRAGEA